MDFSMNICFTNVYLLSQILEVVHFPTEYLENMKKYNEQDKKHL